MASSQNSESVERILETATQLFAAHGYHGVSTRQLAAAAELNVATINYHVGGKAELYRAVFRRAFMREQNIIADAIARVDEEVLADAMALRDALAQLVDDFVTMTLDHPEIPRLWMWRWLESPQGFSDIEAEVSLPLFEAARSLIEKAQDAGTIRSSGPRLRLFLVSFTWMLYGYSARGPIDWQTTRVDPTDPEQVAAFKEFLHDYLCRMLELPTND